MAGWKQQNKRGWDALVQKGNRFTRPAKADQFKDPLRALDSRSWLGESVHGKRVLCLGAGGGKQGPLLAAAGAVVTVVDISAAMLELDRTVAQEHGLVIETHDCSMDDLSPLHDARYDIVSQPVSTCYVPDISAVYKEVARVLKDDGLYLSQHKQPACLQASPRATSTGYLILEPYYRTGPLPQVDGAMYREEGTVEFLHRTEQLFGELCRSGFVIEDVVEPNHAELEAAPGSFGHRSQFLPPFVRIKARRLPRQNDEKARLWIP